MRFGIGCPGAGNIAGGKDRDSSEVACAYCSRDVRVQKDEDGYPRLVQHYTGVPHPDYPAMVWSEPTVEDKVLAVIDKATTPKGVSTAIMAVLDSVGYDSMDREMAFWIASQTKGWDYDDIYDAWLAKP